MTATTTRIQRSRRKGSRLPAGAVCVTRPGRWGNPFPADDDPRRGPLLLGHERAGGRPVYVPYPTTVFGSVGIFRQWLAETVEGRAVAEAARRELAGKVLACWCKVGDPCHGDVLAAVADGRAGLRST